MNRLTDLEEVVGDVEIGVALQQPAGRAKVGFIDRHAGSLAKHDFLFERRNSFVGQALRR
ncbi:hypothetical protein [Paraburkholderia mimosarum]|uniref:hypothetical protein n=1 Tax=Paraburkholderia mimosarum TaxID=312026 RepID=UPI000482B70F|nr:hypothetical protein [Paraburkholderia mimosarum]